MSVAYADIHNSFKYVSNVRWICMRCAFTLYIDPHTVTHVRPCPECGHTEWHQTGKEA